jgi:hypothetical protein
MRLPWIAMVLSVKIMSRLQRGNDFARREWLFVEKAVRLLQS